MSAGRPKGSLGSKTLLAIGILQEKGCEPLSILADIALGNPMKCGIGIEGVIVPAEVLPTLGQRIDAAKELCQYIYPKRKAVEHSGLDGDAIVTRVERIIVDPANSDP